MHTSPTLVTGSAEEPTVSRVTTRKVVILGGGTIAAIHRRSAILAGADIIGVLDSTPEGSEELAARWNLPRGFATIDEVLESDADVVHVCTPNHTHVA